MDNNSVFKRFYNRMAAEGVLKSLLWGIAVGFAVNFITAFVTWFTKFDGLWLSIGLGLGAVAAVTPIMYFAVFRPDSKMIAARLDKVFGLEERLITMAEFEKDESYIAMRQREDAKAKIGGINGRQLKISLSVALIVTAAVSFAFGTTMTTVSALTSAGVIEGGDSFVSRTDFYSVLYDVNEPDGGYIEGNFDQLLEAGELTEPVVAVAEDGWAFVGWDDGYDKPDRCDEVTKEEMTYIAMFVQIEEGDGDGEPGDEDGEPGDSEGGDDAPDKPGEPGDNGNEGKPGEGDPSDGKPGDGSMAGKDDPANQVVDGDKYYRELLESYIKEAEEMLAQGKELPPHLREIMDKYYDIIK